MEQRRLSARKTTIVSLFVSTKKRQALLAQLLTGEIMSAHNIVSPKAKQTTLSRDYLCDDCHEPAMVKTGGGLWCPKCYLKKQGNKIKPLDHGGYYP
jgi:hypothetical protein